MKKTVDCEQKGHLIQILATYSEKSPGNILLKYSLGNTILLFKHLKIFQCKYDIQHFRFKTSDPGGD